MPPPLPEPKKRPPRRYSDVALPSDRYVPGSDQTHPLDPGGHMHGLVLPESEVVSEMAWMLNARWLFGVDCFNNWYFWEAHEVWEPVWKGLDKVSPAGLFIQGLMCVAGGLLKVHAGELEGVQAFWGQSETRLGKAAEARDELFGLKTEKVFKHTKRFFEPCAKGVELELSKRVPQLKLKV